MPANRGTKGAHPAGRIGALQNTTGILPGNRLGSFIVQEKWPREGAHIRRLSRRQRQGRPSRGPCASRQRPLLPCPLQRLSGTAGFWSARTAPYSPKVTSWASGAELSPLPLPGPGHNIDRSTFYLCRLPSAPLFTFGIMRPRCRKSKSPTACRGTGAGCSGLMSYLDY